MMIRIDAALALWIGLAIWALGQGVLFMTLAVNDNSTTETIVSIYRWCTGMGGSVIFLGAVGKVIAHWRSKGRPRWRA